MAPTKSALRDELLGVLRDELERVARAQKETADGATHAEAKPEGSKDTRALEQSYLARGQAQRVVDQRRAVADVGAMSVRDFGQDDPIAVGALVDVEEDDVAQLLFVAPHGGGTMLAGGKVRVVTPSSPVGRALLGRRAGEAAEREAAGRMRTLEIVAVR